MSELLARARVVVTYGGAGALLLAGLGAFVADSPKAGWACAMGAAGILFRELLHVLESRASD